MTLLICGTVSSPIWCTGQSPEPSWGSIGYAGTGSAAEPQADSGSDSIVRVPYRESGSDRRLRSKLRCGSPNGGRPGDGGDRRTTVQPRGDRSIKPSDVVGIKVCANGEPLFSSHPAVIDAAIAPVDRRGCAASKYRCLGSRRASVESGRISSQKRRLPPDVERRQLRSESRHHFADQWKTDLRRSLFMAQCRTLWAQTLRGDPVARRTKKTTKFGQSQ